MRGGQPLHAALWLSRREADEQRDAWASEMRVGGECRSWDRGRETHTGLSLSSAIEKPPKKFCLKPLSRWTPALVQMTFSAVLATSVRYLALPEHPFAPLEPSPGSQTFEPSSHREEAWSRWSGARVPRTQQDPALSLSIWPQMQPSSALEQCTAAYGWTGASAQGSG